MSKNRGPKKGRLRASELEARYSRDARFPCRAKVGYPTRNAARYAAAVTAKELGEPIDAYKCRRAGGGCGDWHIGHPPGWKYAHHRQESTP